MFYDEIDFDFPTQLHCKFKTDVRQISPVVKAHITTVWKYSKKAMRKLTCNGTSETSEKHRFNGFTMVIVKGVLIWLFMKDFMCYVCSLPKKVLAWMRCCCLDIGRSVIKNKSHIWLPSHSGRKLEKLRQHMYGSSVHNDRWSGSRNSGCRWKHFRPVRDHIGAKEMRPAMANVKSTVLYIDSATNGLGNCGFNIFQLFHFPMSLTAVVCNTQSLSFS